MEKNSVEECSKRITIYVTVLLVIIWEVLGSAELNNKLEGCNEAP
jgi:hypothetical protein